MELYADKTPMVAENFRVLCTGGVEAEKSGKRFHLKGSSFHRVINRLFAKGGDFYSTDDKEGGSIHDKKFPAANFYK